MENQQKVSNYKLFYIGLALITLELIILIFSSIFRNPEDIFFDNGGLFLVNYIIAFIYFLAVLIVHKTVFRFNKIPIRYFIVTLSLFSISAFTLNYSIPIFSQFPLWVLIYLNLFYASYLGICFIDKLPRFIRIILFFVLGLGVVIVAYFTAYLIPLYHIAILAFIVLGLSVHLIVPLLVLISIFIIFVRLEKTRIEKIAFISGIIIPLIILSVFLVRWNQVKTEIHNASSSIVTRPDNTLPEWVLFCQDIPSDEFSQRIIKGSLVYDTFYNLWDGWNNTSFDEVKKHDPMVNVGLALMGDINLDNDTRIKILKSQYNARHIAQRKLWTGRELETTDVLNDIKIYPDYRFAYTEKIITIKNSSRWVENRQEAAYTFYLPEGSVATSLSLWINGKEEKSRLTTKSNADIAYSTIVGVEQRDPALLHWQEGNTLTVTIFPCTPKENRKFKIGISSPLEKNDNLLKLGNIYFDGPIPKNVIETTHISILSEHKIEVLDLPDGFKKDIDNNYTYTGNFRPYWEIQFKATPLSNRSFTFNNYSYHLNELKKQKEDIDLKYIYLDINSSWNRKGYEEIIRNSSTCKCFAFHDKMIEINNENKEQVFELLSKKQFSLFPFHKIKNTENAIVVSRSNELSPNLSDLDGSIFLKDLISKISSDNNYIKLYQLGNISSPYIKSLKEFGVFSFDNGNTDKLNKYIINREYVKRDTTQNQIDIDIANVSIHRENMNGNGKAPDHLLRLYAYNKLMKVIGRNYFNKDADYINKVLDIANEAYIVSPISSLIVLETVKDYERFGIEENQNSLKNASMKSSGAVPEPSEWALIILFIILLFTLFFRKIIFSKFGWQKN